MYSLAPALENWNQLGSSGNANLCVGQVLEVTAQGHGLVDFPGNEMGPLRARSIVRVPPGQDPTCLENLSVLLAFESGDATLPIILGFVRDTLCAPPAPAAAMLSLPPGRPQEGTVDGARIVFDAKEEIVLRCGKSSLTLRKDGKVVVKGAEIVSRATGANKIKGAAVKIN
jgi:hypothetical protein